MQGDGTLGNAGTTHKIPFHIVEQLITVHIAVGIGRRDGQFVIVEQTGAEGTDDKSRPVKGLMHGRRLMHLAGNGHEIPDIENPGIKIAVPAHHVKGVMRQGIVLQALPYPHLNGKLTRLVPGCHRFRHANIPLAKGGVFQELPVFVQIPLRRGDFPHGLHNQKAGLNRLVITQPVQGSAGDNDIISRAKGQAAEKTFQHAAAVVHKNQLIGMGVAVKISGLFFGHGHGHNHILIIDQHTAPA